MRIAELSLGVLSVSTLEHCGYIGLVHQTRQIA